MGCTVATERNLDGGAVNMTVLEMCDAESVHYDGHDVI